MSDFARRGSAVAVAIEGFFAAGWLSWAASDPPSWLPIPLRVLAVLALVVAVVGVVIAVRSGPDPGDPRGGMGGRAYRVIVVVEVAAIAGGSVAFGATGHQDYIAAWIALVVGVHFFPLATVFGRGSMRVIGALICAVSVAAFVVGASTGVTAQTVAGAGVGVILLASALVLLAVIGRRA